MIIYQELGRTEALQAELDAYSIERLTNLRGYLLSLRGGLRAATDLAEVSVEIGDEDKSSILYELLLPYAHINDYQILTYGFAKGSVSRCLGMLATSLQRFDSAEQHFELALEKNLAWGFDAWAAYTQHGWADMLLQRDQPGDRDRADQLLTQAQLTADQIGMVRLQSMITELRQTLPSISYPAGLTEREVEVLRLVAEGVTNPEIADQLFVSPRTISNHVTNIFNKLNVNSRAAAAAEAVRLGLA